MRVDQISGLIIHYQNHNILFRSGSLRIKYASTKLDTTDVEPSNTKFSNGDEVITDLNKFA